MMQTTNKLQKEHTFTQFSGHFCVSVNQSLPSSLTASVFGPTLTVYGRFVRSNVNKG